VHQVLRNAVKWAHNPAPAWKGIEKAPNAPIETAREKTCRKRLQAAQAWRRGFSLMAGKKLLLLGTGGIAVHHVDQFAQVPECKIVACVDAVPGRAAEFAKRHRIAKAFDGLDQAIRWGWFRCGHQRHA
jgi:hypothetical protein